MAKKKCRHEWLFVKEIMRHTDKSQELCEAGKKYLEKNEQKDGFLSNLFGSVDHYSRAAHITFMITPMFMQPGRKYTCVKCNESKELF